MQPTPNLRDTDPHDVFVIEPDVSLAARADKASLDLLYDVLSRPSDPAPVRPDPSFASRPISHHTPACRRSRSLTRRSRTMSRSTTSGSATPRSVRTSRGPVNSPAAP